MIRVYTYSDPFKLNERQFWGDITKYPHICASHTLVQGLNSYYKRGSFTIRSGVCVSPTNCPLINNTP